MLVTVCTANSLFYHVYVIFINDFFFKATWFQFEIYKQTCLKCFSLHYAIPIFPFNNLSYLPHFNPYVPVKDTAISFRLVLILCTAPQNTDTLNPSLLLQPSTSTTMKMEREMHYIFKMANV